MGSGTNSRQRLTHKRINRYPLNHLQNLNLWSSHTIGFIRKEDVTNVLKSQNFWPSYNTPYFPGTFQLNTTFLPIIGLTPWVKCHEQILNSLTLKTDKIYDRCVREEWKP